MSKPPKAPALYVGAGLTIKPGWTLLGAKTALYAAGFTFLGGGAVAGAYLSPKGDRVVKLVCGDRGHRIAVDMFIAHDRLKAFPRVYGVVELARGCFAYETELLSETEAFFDLEYGGSRRRYGWRSAFTDATHDALDFWQRRKLVGVDMHEKNMMARADGTLVLSDPFHAGDAHEADRLASWAGHRTAYEAFDAWDADHDLIWSNVRWRVPAEVRAAALLAA